MELRRRPLAVCIASLFTLAAPAAMATNRLVTSCLDDGGPGTLRSVIASASTVSGDTVDLSALACAKITLAADGSRILVPQDSLTIKGPGATALAIDGSALPAGGPNDSNVFEHTGSGTLTIKYLSVTGGHKETLYGALGGCIYSNANVTLDGAAIAACSVSSGDGAEGGGVYARGDLVAVNSIVSGNLASSPGPVRGGGLLARGDVILVQSVVSDNLLSGGGRAAGGGIYAYGKLNVVRSTVHANTAFALNPDSVAAGGGAVALGDFGSAYATISDNHLDAPHTSGGGLSLYGSATITASTISGNSGNKGGVGGGINAYSNPSAGHAFLMRNSTVSGNSSANTAGGIYVNAATTKIYNSTIAFNTATNSAPGLRFGAVRGPIEATLQSTLMSDNLYTNVPTENDLATTGGTVTFNSAPANNLIRVTAASGLPSDTLFSACPLLGPLRDNGGPTRTHALLSSSPAIDAGNDVSIDPLTQLPYAYDQRGSAADNGVGDGDYPRVSGAAADIGAYEVQQDDIVFNGGFEGCS